MAQIRVSVLRRRGLLLYFGRRWQSTLCETADCVVGGAADSREPVLARATMTTTCHRRKKRGNYSAEKINLELPNQFFGGREKRDIAAEWGATVAARGGVIATEVSLNTAAVMAQDLSPTPLPSGADSWRQTHTCLLFCESGWNRGAKAACKPRYFHEYIIRTGSRHAKIAMLRFFQWPFEVPQPKKSHVAQNHFSLRM